ncbi:MAG: hypothetical protein ACLGI2_10255 [Acidimicrobiia bacterium]
MNGGRARRRLLAFAATAVLPFLAPPAASAQSSLNVEITSPGDGASVAGTFTPEIAGNVYTGIGVDVDVIRVVLARNDGTVLADTKVCCDQGRNGTVPFSFTAPNLSRNGPYTVRVVATGHFLINGLAVTPASADRTFSMAVPPAPPNLAQPQVIDRSVKLTWTPGRADPDLMGYIVYRKVGTSPFVGIIGVAANVNTYTDDKLPPDLSGPVQYRVDALRQPAVLTDDPNKWLARPSAAVTATLPPPPTTTPLPTQPGEPTTSTTPGGGLQPDGAVSNTDLGRLFGTGGGSVPSFPTPTIPAIPDPGFSELLPFPEGSAGADRGGRQRAVTDDELGEVEAGNDLDDTNRRALLVPVAGGSVLCVAALHLRWLSRRLATGAVVAAGTAGGPGPGPTDLEPAEPGPDAFAPDREPVGAGSPAARGRG